MFAVYYACAPEAEPPLERILVDAPRFQSLAQSFEVTWKLPPTASGQQGLTEGYLVEKVFCREAQKLGIDQDDVVIRRRMRQEAEFVLQDALARMAPQETELVAFLERDPAAYAELDRIAFRQIYLGHGDVAVKDVDMLLARLNGKEIFDAGDLG